MNRVGPLLVKVIGLTWFWLPAWLVLAYPPETKAGISLVVSPPKINFGLVEPGAHLTSQVQVSNPTSRGLRLTVQKKDLELEGDQGELKAVEGEAKQWSLAHWVKLTQESFWLDPGVKVSVPFEIVVPRNAEPGGHYAGLYFQAEPEGNQVKVGIRVGTIIKLGVRGKVNRTGRLLYFGPESRFFVGQRPQLILRLSNQGNIHLEPFGETQILSLLGKEVKTISLSNQDIFPKSTREYRLNWSDSPSFGYFRALVKIKGLAKETQIAETSFLVLPVSPSIGLLGLLLVILVIFVKKGFLAKLVIVMMLIGWLAIKRAGASSSVPVRVEIIVPAGKSRLPMPYPSEKPEVLGAENFPLLKTEEGDPSSNFPNQKEDNRQGILSWLDPAFDDEIGGRRFWFLGTALVIMGVSGVLATMLFWLREKLKT